MVRLISYRHDGGGVSLQPVGVYEEHARPPRRGNGLWGAGVSLARAVLAAAEVPLSAADVLAPGQEIRPAWTAKSALAGCKLLARLGVAVRHGRGQDARYTLIK
jgi:hypothetical protein